MKVRIRKCTDSDIPAVIDLSQGLFREDSGKRDPHANMDWPSEHGKDYFSGHIARSDSLIIVASARDAIVGYLVGYMRGPDSLRFANVAELESMYVTPEARDKQVGSALIVEFSSWATGQGADRISVTAHAMNQGAIRFYERQGFSPWHLTLERQVGS